MDCEADGVGAAVEESSSDAAIVERRKKDRAVRRMVPRRGGRERDLGWGFAWWVGLLPQWGFDDRRMFWFGRGVWWFRSQWWEGDFYGDSMCMALRRCSGSESWQVSRRRNIEYFGEFSGCRCRDRSARGNQSRLDLDPDGRRYKRLVARCKVSIAMDDDVVEVESSRVDLDEN